MRQQEKKRMQCASQNMFVDPLLVLNRIHHHWKTLSFGIAKTKQQHDKLGPTEKR